GLQVANRDTWTVAALAPDGSLAVTGEHGTRLLPAGYVTEHVELGYACTVHGVQGLTATAAHLALGEHTGAASAYVALTRGRETNIAHLVADSVDEAREQWVAAFARARADLGPAHAAHLAQTEAANYAPGRPVEQVLAELRTAWAREDHMIEQLDQAQHTADVLQEIIELRARRDDIAAPLEAALHRAQQRHRDAAARADASSAAIRVDTGQQLKALLAGWDRERSAAHLAALVIERGPGRFGRRRHQVDDARQQLHQWAARWRPHYPTLPSDTDALLRYALARQNIGELDRALTPAAHQRATSQHPEHDNLVATARATRAELTAARAALADATRPLDRQLAQLPPISNPHQRLADLEHARHDARSVLDAARHHIEALQRDPALLANPERLETSRARWQLEHARERSLNRSIGAPGNRPLQQEYEPLLRSDDGPSISL
ncbi:MAG: TrwC relaxase, partial [Jatrophihabitans endophyticus]